MKGLMISIVALSLATGNAAAQAEEPKTAAAPVLVCKEPSYDFGVAANTGTVEHTFTLWNEGDAPLEISRVTFCCGSSGRLTDKVVAPGSNTTLSVTLSLKGRSGQQQKRITVLSNDPQQPRYLITFTGTAKAVPDLEAGRVSVHLGNVLEGQDAEKTIEISAPSNVVFQITNIVNSSTNLIAEKKDASPQDHNITLKVVQPLPKGTTEATINLFTDHPLYKTVEVHATVSIVSDLLAVPQQIRVTLPNEQQEPVVVNISVRSRSATPFKILSAEVAGTGITVEREPVADSAYTLKLVNVVPSVELRGKTLVIKTDLEHGGELSVPFMTVEAEAPGQ